MRLVLEPRFAVRNQQAYSRNRHLSRLAGALAKRGPHCHRLPGVVVIDGDRASFLCRICHRAIALIVREANP